MAQNPNQVRAADAVGSWLAKNLKNPAWLVETTGADPGTIGDFLNHKRWPKTGTQGRIEGALGWPAGIIRQIGNGSDFDLDVLLASESPSTVGGRPQDAGYVASPGEQVEGGSSNDEVLQSIREMRDDMRALRQAIERLADAAQQRS